MEKINESSFGTFAGKWLWLFPITYLVHIAEEYWGGEGFYRWISRLSGAELTAERFISLNTTFWVIMATGIAIVVFTSSQHWIALAFGTIVLINGSAHTIGSILTQSYSPGLFSGLLLWIPLGAITLRRGWKLSTRGQFAVGLIIGIVLHAMVTLTAINQSGNSVSP